MILIFYTTDHVTNNIFVYNIEIKRYCDKETFILSKYCSYISKSIQTNRNEYFQFTQEKKILDEKCLFIAISFYRNAAILCVKMSCVNKASRKKCLMINKFAKDSEHFGIILTILVAVNLLRATV
jgi:hypothetical protein